MSKGVPKLRPRSCEVVGIDVNDAYLELFGELEGYKLNSAGDYGSMFD